ncbi:nitroreductase family protein [Deltaproteobacteria bacterium OttesenSCG-928-K17]|nr:nitroreductase family protein [Deltaproteobacteria bacterium OttesenSCG-928-K17]
MPMFSVNDKCVKCGLCAELCVAGIIKYEKGLAPDVAADKEGFCIQCGQCVSFCPAGACFLSFQNERRPLDASLRPSPEAAEAFLKSRRSIRRFNDQPLEDQQVRRIIDVTRYGPTAGNAQPVRWIITADRAQTLELGALVAANLKKTAAANPGDATCAVLGKVGQAFERGRDVIFRSAPQLAVAVVDKACRYPEDAAIALTYFELAAHALGIGCCWAGYFTTAARACVDIQKMLGVGSDEFIVGGQMFGKPKGLGWPHILPPRREAEISWLGGGR